MFVTQSRYPPQPPVFGCDISPPVSVWTDHSGSGDTRPPPAPSDQSQWSVPAKTMTTIKYPEIMLILDGDQHHLLVQQVVGVILGRRAAHEVPAVDEHNHGTLLGLDHVPVEMVKV